MSKRVQTMIHVADVEATAHWYRDKLDFDIVDLGSDGRDIIFGRIELDGTQILLSAGGSPTIADRRDADFFVQTDDVEGALARLPKDVPIIEPIHETFYGTTEFIIRDLNGFWITFSQPKS
jgi:catechol 2,3-dioxygenase-like lactoylglutathione lyase family enzyme